jgi:hypothetical protein
MSQAKRKIKEEVEEDEEMEGSSSKRSKRADEAEAPHPVALVLNRRGMVSKKLKFS